MQERFATIGALLLGSAALMFAGGINGLILPLRGTEEGFSSFALGLLGTGWALGYVSGCLSVPKLVGRVGHIRAFSVMAGLAAVSILLSLLFIHAWAWIVLRALAGFCFAGAAMIVESWINERTPAEARGGVFGVYTMVNLAATTAGQMVLMTGDPGGYAFFVLAAIFYALSLLPTAVTLQIAPQPMVGVSLDLPALWRNSPLAVAGVILVGVSNGAFGTLGAVYGSRIGLSVETIAIFMSIAVVAGAALQVPVGFLSDRMDRRFVLLGLAAIAAAVDVTFVFIAPTTPMLVLALASVFGAAVYAMYPVIVAHANDHAPEGYFLRTSGGLLLLFGVGSIIGPLMAGLLMNAAGPSGLFINSLAAHAVLILYGAWRISRREAPSLEDKGSFHTVSVGTQTTPQTNVLNPGADEEEEAEILEENAPESAPEKHREDA